MSWHSANTAVIAEGRRVLINDRLLALSERGVRPPLAPVIPWIVTVPKPVSVASSHKLTRG